MAEVHTSESSIGENINELYWNSDRTVDEIVDDLGIGRNTLYSAVRPQPAGANCPDCGERLVFTNRSNRSSATATCRGCGLEADLSVRREGEAAQELPMEADFHRHDHRAPEPYPEEGGWTRWRHELAAVAPERAAMIGGAAALGVVVGAVAARAMREMR